MQYTQIALRPANQEDMSFLLDLRKETMDAHLVASDISFSVEEHMRRLLYRFDCAQIVELAGEAVGLLKVSRDGDAWHLIQIQLKPILQGQGLGTQLIQTVIHQARNAGASLSLNVLKANPAFRLYERLGFVVVQDAPDSYEMVLARGDPNLVPLSRHIFSDTKPRVKALGSVPVPLRGGEYNIRGQWLLRLAQQLF